MDCKKLQFSFINMIDNRGVDKLFSFMFTSIQITNSIFQDLFSEPPEIFEVLSSNFTLTNTIFNNFYPRLIYATGSHLNISNCSFSNSSYINFLRPMTVIYLEYIITFLIENSNFTYLMNNLNGPV